MLINDAIKIIEATCLPVHLDADEREAWQTLKTAASEQTAHKAEIAALATEIESCLGRIPRGDKVFSLTAKMRQV